MNLNLGIIGWPLQKTYSPIIHEFLGEFLGIDVRYDKIPLENINKHIIQNINAKLDGYNVTVPYKSKLVNLIGNLDNFISEQNVKDLRICNTIKLKDNNIYAYNTDVYGISNTLDSIYEKIINKKFLILGSGGSAKTIEYLFQKQNQVTLVSRQANSNSISYDQLNDIAPEIDILINATPIGMPPFENDELSIPYDRFNNLEVFFNLGYNVNKNFLSKFSDEVIKVDGLKMLITQAVASFNIWTDSEINIEDVYHNITERLKNEN